MDDQRAVEIFEHLFNAVIPHLSRDDKNTILSFFETIYEDNFVLTKPEDRVTSLQGKIIVFDTENDFTHPRHVLDRLALMLFREKEYTACGCAYLDVLQIRNSSYDADVYL